MNKLGKFFRHERLKERSKRKIVQICKIITGEVEAPKCYTKGKDEIYDKKIYLHFRQSARG
ncbi:MAG: hypothetical protein L6V95_02880 [Candidatus Melainabacteria bacterium]|nr:MAG: hypothetical protein L6V95_02880 [Candidatus Melainabacteria bacterium]